MLVEPLPQMVLHRLGRVLTGHGPHAAARAGIAP
jgi:hypothetical protein